MNLSSIPHSVMNTLKRVFIVFGSLIYFVNPVTNVQVVGMLVVEAGVALFYRLYSYTRLKYYNQQVIDRPKKTQKNKIFKLILLVFLCITIYGSFVSKTGNLRAHTRNQKSYFRDVSPDKHLICINKIRNQIAGTFRKIIPKETKFVDYLMVPNHIYFGIGDHLVRYDFILFSLRLLLSGNFLNILQIRP